MSELINEVKQMHTQIIDWRRHFHQNAELSFQEYKTSDFIEEQLKSFGNIEISRPTKTGVIAKIHGKSNGPTIALRADIDALPMTETNDLPYVSVNKEAMHSCGHDGHAAILLGIAKIFSEKTEQLSGTLVCIFQHAEELPPGGAIELVKAGVMEGVDEIYGLHLSSNYPTGKFGVVSGALTSATDRFDIKVIGKGGHSSLPEQCVDPIVTASQIVMGLQNIVARRISAYEKAVLSVCQIHGGDAYNIIPGQVMITGSVRTFSKDLRSKMPEMIAEISDGIAKSNGAVCEASYEPGYDSVMNDEALIDIAREVITDWFGIDAVLEIQPVMPGEDFSAFTEATGCPGCFIEIGTRNEEKGTTRPHHNTAYLMDEDGLYYGMGLFAAMIEKKMMNR
ncbi:N-acetyldiaminopimelate deacetylase [bioreactor metagenome]|uniref:N-acetyldiaminopimelate deacetylase n=1 Tax=bioreactor metagenome TaxID=1076179 RepID=A0A644YAN8_9ZZZZ|nr:amidohydrolase [Candidatus Metalachnospira sp.]